MMKKFLSLVAIAAIALSFAACDDSGVVNPEQETKVEGAFSVGPDSKVFFAKGNLQRLAGSFQTPVSPWLFAAHQYDTVGNAPMSIHSDLHSRDLLESGDLYFKDWRCSDIRNDQEGHTWRVLGADEWLYLFHERRNAERLFGLGSVNGINGVFILPDNYWDKPANVTFTPSPQYPESEENAPLVWKNDIQRYELTRIMINGFLHNTFNLDEWARLEEAGVIFLPAAGGYEHGKPHYVNYGGIYASCTPNLESANDYAYALVFYGFNAYLYPASGYQEKSSYCAVRLVQDIQPTEAPSSVVARAKEELTEWGDIAKGTRAWLIEQGNAPEDLQDIDDAMTTAEQVNNNANATLEDVEAAIDALRKAHSDYFSFYFDVWKAQQISDLDHLADLNPRTAVQNLVNEAKVQINAIEWDFREDDNQIIELRARIKEIVETVKKKVEKL